MLFHHSLSLGVARFVVEIHNAVLLSAVKKVEFSSSSFSFGGSSPT